MISFQSYAEGRVRVTGALQSNIDFTVAGEGQTFARFQSRLRVAGIRPIDFFVIAKRVIKAYVGNRRVH